jgi:sodium-dependent dicarboxylate transporter 2/3/5
MKPLIALASGFGVWAALRGFGADQALAGGIFAFTVVMWITEALPLPITGLLSTVLLIGAGLLDEKAAFASYGNPTLILLICSLILAKGMEVTKLGDRMAYWILSRPWANRSSGTLLAALGGVACLISLFVSNTATTAMLLPVGLAILGSMKEQTTQSRYAISVMLMLTWGSSVALGLPIGTPPNLLGMAAAEQAGYKISFLQWAGFAMPMTVLLILCSWAWLSWQYGAGKHATSDAADLSRAKLAELGPLSAPQKGVLGAFAVAMFLWLAPDASGFFLGPDHPVAAWMDAKVSEAVAACVGAGALFLIPLGKGEKIMGWKEASSVEWGILLLFGGGIALGDAMFKTGLAKSLGEAAASATGATGMWGIAALMIAAAIVLSELASNTAAATTLLPLAGGLAEGAGVNPLPAILGVALGASLGFMFPVSTAPNAIVYSSGLVPSKEMMKSGIVIDVIGFFVIFGCLRVFLPLLGLV